VLEILQTLPVDWFSAVVTFVFVLGMLLILIFRNNEWFPVNTPLAILLSILAVFVLYVISAFLEMFSKSTFATSVEQWGQVGDFFGGMLNPVLAFASFMALLYTIRIQSKQLDVSTKELEAARQELKASREAQERSSAALDGQLQNLKVQQFEATFFKLVENLRHSTVKVEVNIDSLKNHILNPTTPGPRSLSGQISGYNPKPFEGTHRWKEARLALQNKENSGFYLMAHSVRSALSFIKHSEVDLSLSPHFYVEQVLNSLTTDMLRLIVVWCSNYEENEFRKLVERYHFFANLRMQSHDTLGHGLPISELVLDMKAFEFAEEL